MKNNKINTIDDVSEYKIGIIDDEKYKIELIICITLFFIPIFIKLRIPAINIKSANTTYTIIS